MGDHPGPARPALSGAHDRGSRGSDELLAALDYDADALRAELLAAIDRDLGGWQAFVDELVRDADALRAELLAALELVDGPLGDA